jgi:hypothetical protein
MDVEGSTGSRQGNLGFTFWSAAPQQQASVCWCSDRLLPVVVCFFSYIFNKFEVILEEQDSKNWRYVRVSLILNVP